VTSSSARASSPIRIDTEVAGDDFSTTLPYMSEVAKIVPDSQLMDCIRAKAKHRRKELRQIEAGFLGGDDDITKETEQSDKRTNVKTIQQYNQHSWIKKHSRAADTEDGRMSQTRMMRKWFDFLDADGSGEVGVNELEDPLVSVGLARCRKDVTTLIHSVDKTKNGEITFHDFMSMMEDSHKVFRLHIMLSTSSLPYHFHIISFSTTIIVTSSPSPRHNDVTKFSIITTSLSRHHKHVIIVMPPSPRHQ
jgi:hypothetical protein